MNKKIILIISIFCVLTFFVSCENNFNVENEEGTVFHNLAIDIPSSCSKNDEKSNEYIQTFENENEKYILSYFDSESYFDIGSTYTGLINQIFQEGGTIARELNVHDNAAIIFNTTSDNNFICIISTPEEIYSIDYTVLNSNKSSEELLNDFIDLIEKVDFKK